MKSNDLIHGMDDIRAEMHEAVKNNDTEKFFGALDNMIGTISEKIKSDYEDLRDEQDVKILAARGVRQLTSKEYEYYSKLADAMRSRDPRQAVSNLDLVMPETVYEDVFDELRQAHPLLSRIDFVPTNGAIKMIMDTSGVQKGAWGTLCAEIVSELTGGFKVVDTTLMKASAFIPVCKAMLELGPAWLDRYVREILLEALSVTLEEGIVNGTGKESPIGMTRQVGDGVSVVSGEYPKKEAITVNDLTPATVGKLLALMAKSPSGKNRRVDGLIFIVNPQDYYEKIMPATTVMAPDGTYRNDVMPYPMTIIQSGALDRGEAVLGMARRYFGAAGISTDGRIEYSDEYRFLEDERVYTIKTYANGMPKDNNAFLLLDIDGITPARWEVTQIEPRTPSNVATLSSLKVGGLTLSPEFSSGTKSYTATTTNATNVVTAMPTDANAEIVVKVGAKQIENGSAATWEDGSNTLTIAVTAEDGTTTDTYTVTVTKS